MVQSYEIQFAKALALTLLIEGTILWTILRKGFLEKKQSISFILFTGLVANLSTLPLAWFFFPAFTAQTILVLVSEGFAVFFETAVYAVLLKTTFSKAFFVSFFCNVLSFSLGLVLLPKL